VKRFQYTTRRRYCPQCGGDGHGRIFPGWACARCAGEGHLPEEPPPGERYIELVHDQSGKVVDIRPVKGNEPDTGNPPVILLFAAIVAAIALLTVLVAVWR
jgi:DnaJ-class molecular chaperone